MVRTRFAPSPTGYLHVGGVRTALFAWLIAKQSKGKFILRIEDTDRSRHVEESEQHIIASLAWLGLEWDEGPIRQSDRLKIYHEWAKKLIDLGAAYADPYSQSQLDELRQAAKTAKRPFLFRQHRPDKPPKWQAGLPLRFKSEPRQYKWRDEVMGELSSGPEAIDDFIILKADGFPTYNFAHIVDDHLMQITHVTRSQEFLPSVPKYLNLYDVLKIEPPKLVTLPFVLAPEGNRKLSKRDGAKDILDYKAAGYLPEALNSFMATLGWSDGTDQEVFTIAELIKMFSLERVQRSSARFDENRLNWVNGHFIRELPLNQLAKRAEDFWPVAAKHSDHKYKHAVLELLHDRLKYLDELSQLSGFFFSEPSGGSVSKLYAQPPDKQLKSMPAKDFRPLLQAALTELQDSDFSEADISTRLNRLLTELDSKPGVLFPLIRIAISGQASTPELSPTLAVLGKEKSLKRLQRALVSLEKVQA